MITKEAFQEFLYQAIPLIKKLNIVIDELTSDFVQTHLPEETFNNNHFQTVYAGIQFSVMEVTGGILFSVVFDVKKFFIVVRRMSIEYLKPARGSLICKSTFPDEKRTQLVKVLEEQGKAETSLIMELFDSNGQKVAQGEAVYFISPQRK